MTYSLQHVLLTALCLIPCLGTVAAESGPVPDTLFGVTLGTVSGAGESCPVDVAPLPIKKCAGIEASADGGLNYYFQPELDYGSFRYIEEAHGDGADSYKTSFRLHMQPAAGDQFQVSGIEWRRHMDNRREAYYWARNMCKSVAIDLGRKADISYSEEDLDYHCELQDANSKMIIEGRDGDRVFSLTVPDSAM